MSYWRTHLIGGVSLPGGAGESGTVQVPILQATVILYCRIWGVLPRTFLFFASLLLVPESLCFFLQMFQHPIHAPTTSPFGSELSRLVSAFAQITYCLETAHQMLAARKVSSYEFEKLYFCKLSCDLLRR